MQDSHCMSGRPLVKGLPKEESRARALAVEPAVLLCDKITAALDPEFVGEVLQVLEMLAHEGMTLIHVGTREALHGRMREADHSVQGLGAILSGHLRGVHQTARKGRQCLLLRMN
jgi:ABC-type ATPase involved in cell division